MQTRSTSQWNSGLMPCILLSLPTVGYAFVSLTTRDAKMHLRTFVGRHLD